MTNMNKYMNAIMIFQGIYNILDFMKLPVLDTHYVVS